jgi:hypothetical protein
MSLIAGTLTGLCFSVSSANLLAAGGQTFGPDPQIYQKTAARATRFLAAQQSDDGALSPQIGIGPTALARVGPLRNGGALAARS